MASCFVRKTGIVCVRYFRRARVLGIINALAIRFGLLDLRIMNALAAWMFHGRAYAGGRFACLFRNA